MSSTLICPFEKSMYCLSKLMSSKTRVYHCPVFNWKVISVPTENFRVFGECNFSIWRNFWLTATWHKQRKKRMERYFINCVFRLTVNGRRLNGQTAQFKSVVFRLPQVILFFQRGMTVRHGCMYDFENIFLHIKFENCTNLNIDLSCCNAFEKNTRYLIPNSQ